MALVDQPRADCVTSELGIPDCDVGPRGLLNSHEGRAFYWVGTSMKLFWAGDVVSFRDCAERGLAAAREVGEPLTRAWRSSR